MVNSFDSFEDGDMSEYEQLFGFGDAPSISSSNPFDNSLALDLNPNDSKVRHETYIHSTASRSVSDGGGFGLHFSPNITGDTNHRLLFGFALQSRDDRISSLNGYHVEVEFIDQNISLVQSYGDEFLENTTIASQSLTESLQTDDRYYRLSVQTWDSDGNITVKLTDESTGSEIASISAVDTTYTDGAWPGIEVDVYSGPPTFPTPIQP